MGGSLFVVTCTYFSRLSLEKCWPQKASDATITHHIPTRVTALSLPQRDDRKS